MDRKKTMYFQNTQEFLSLFSGYEEQGYFDPIPLQDRKVAFSIKRPYPENIRYKPPKKENGDPDNVVAMWVIYAHPEESKEEITPRHVPIRARSVNFSRYLHNRFDYDFNDHENCPTQSSIETSKATPRPIDLEYIDEFFYDHELRQFVDETGNVLTPLNFLNRLYQEHCDTVHWLKGIKLRFKLISRSKAIGIVSLIITLLINMLKSVFGRTLEVNDTLSAYYRGYRAEEFKKLTTDSLNIFGYKASKSVIVLFCIIIILVCIGKYTYGLNKYYFELIVNSEILSIIHAIFLLWILDSIVPQILFHILNLFIRFRKYIMLAKIKTN